MDKTKKTIFASIKAIIFFGLVTATAYSQQMTKEQYDQKMRQWHQISGGQVGYDTFEKGMSWFLAKCASGSCSPCLLSITETTNKNTSKTWIGTFDANGPKTITNTLTATHDGNTAERIEKGVKVGYRSTTPNLANKYGRCTTGGSRISCSGNSCNVVSGYHSGTQLDVASVQSMENHLGEKATHLIMYGISFGQGQLMYHDGHQCHPSAMVNGQCYRTWGCLVQYPKQMKQFCQEYVNPAGGVYVYTDGTQYSNAGPNQTRGSWQAAAKAFEKSGSVCNTINGSPLTTYTPSSGSSMSGAVESRRYRTFAGQDTGSDYSPGNSFDGQSNSLTGNDSFRNCQATSSTDYKNEVVATRNGSDVNSRDQLAKEASVTDSTFGGGEQNARAGSLNNMHKNCVAAAAMDPRSEAFTSNNSSENPITKFFMAFLSIFKPAAPTPELQYESNNR